MSNIQWKQVQPKQRTSNGRGRGGGHGGGATAAGGFVRGAPAPAAPAPQQESAAGGGGRGGRGGGGSGFNYQRPVGQVTQGPGGALQYRDQGYPGTRGLHTVILREKVQAQYPQVKIDVETTAGGQDSNGYEMISIVSTVSGPQAQEALNAFRNRRIAKAIFYMDQGGEFMHQRAATAAEKIQMCITTSRQGPQTKVVVSTMVIPGEANPPAEQEMIARARALLTQENQQQTLRGQRQSKTSEYQDPFEEEYDHQVVTGGQRGGRRGGAREQLNALMYKTELDHADQLPPKDALNYLGRLVHQKVQEGADSDFLAWLAFLYEVEVHGVLAELAEYELHGIRLKLSPDMRGVAIIKIDISSGIRPFTERRPSVMIEDDVLLHFQAPGGRSAVYRAPIFNVMADAVWIHVDNLKPVDNKTSKDDVMGGGPSKTKFNKEATQAELLGHIRDHAMFKVAFDPAPYVGRCKQLGTSAARNHQAFRFLQSKDPGVNMPHLESLVNRTADRANTRQSTRSSRGGRNFGGEQANNEDPHHSLETKQRYAAQLIVNGPDNVRKIFIEGPCGTGKTHTICHSVKHLLETDPQARVLMLSPSHSASDVAAVRLVQMMGDAVKDNLLRVYPKGRSPLRCPEVLFPLTNFHPRKPFSKVNYQDRFDVELLQEPGYMNHRIVITSLSSVGQVFRALRGHDQQQFTHIFIDEVAQAAMAETLNGLSHHCDMEKVKFIFSGDTQQIGPRCYAQACSRWLKESACRYLPNSAVFVQLDVSYRQVPALARLQSMLFYKGRLQTADTMEKTGLDGWGGHHDKPNPLRFIHVGKEPQQVKSSLVNKAEVNVILNCILSLRGELNVQLSDMVVFTQFREQRRALTSAFAMRGCKGVQVKEIEDFHGDEKDVVIMSLVQAEENELSYDRKQLNTAIGRTAKLCLIVGNGEMTLNSKEPKWVEIMEELLKLEAVDGFNYDDEEFDDKLWVPQPARALVDSIKEFNPQTRRQEADEQFQRLSRQDVLANNMSYFVGIVSGVKDWSQGGSMFVRHRHVSGVDIALDEDATTGLRKDFIFDGDLIAVKVDEKTTRWRDVELFRGPTPNVPFSQPDVFCPLDTDTETTTLEDFESCIPQILGECRARPKQPTGKVVALLSQPALPPLVGVVSGGKVFCPLNKRFPRFAISNPPRSLGENDVVIATLDRNTGEEPKYTFVSHAPQPFKLEDVLLAKVPRFPNGAVANADVLLDENEGVPFTAIAFRNGQCAFNAAEYEGKWWVECYIPAVAQYFAQVPEMEEQAQSRGCPLWQAPVLDFCDKRRVPLFESHQKWRTTFWTAAMNREPCWALRIRFPALSTDGGIPVPCVDPDTLIRQTRINTVKVQPFQADDPNCVQMRTNLGSMAYYLQQERSIVTGTYADPIDQSHDIQVMNELETWTNYVAAVVMVRTIPTQSLLVRQDPPQDYRTGNDERQRVERAEYWVPNSVPITRGFHSGTAFPVFAQVCRPCERYGDVLTQRLLLIATKLRIGRQLLKDELELTKSVKKHAVWLNTMPLIYGEIVRD